MRDFAKENPLLVIKGGIYEGKSITPAELMELANLESREVLLAKLAGAMKGSFAKAARIIDALRIKMEAVSEPTPVVEAPAAVEEVQVVEAVTETAPEAVTEEVTTPEETPETEEKE
jgi:large subunit ribosomal protein L10